MDHVGAARILGEGFGGGVSQVGSVYALPGGGRSVPWRCPNGPRPRGVGMPAWIAAPFSSPRGISCYLTVRFDPTHRTFFLPPSSLHLSGRGGGGGLGAGIDHIDHGVHPRRIPFGLPGTQRRRGDGGEPIVVEGPGRRRKKRWRTPTAVVVVVVVVRGARQIQKAQQRQFHARRGGTAPAVGLRQRRGRDVLRLRRTRRHVDGDGRFRRRRRSSTRIAALDVRGVYAGRRQPGRTRRRGADIRPVPVIPHGGGRRVRCRGGGRPPRRQSRCGVHNRRGEAVQRRRRRRRSRRRRDLVATPPDRRQPRRGVLALPDAPPGATAFGVEHAVVARAIDGVSIRGIVLRDRIRSDRGAVRKDRRVSGGGSRRRLRGGAVRAYRMSWHDMGHRQRRAIADDDDGACRFGGDFDGCPGESVRCAPAPTVGRGRIARDGRGGERTKIERNADGYRH